MKILITGINGFVGHHLTRELKNRGHIIVGLGTKNKIDGSIANLVEEYFSIDLTKQEEVSSINLDSLQGIINLAGLANVGASFAESELYRSVNVKVLSVLGEELLKKCPEARLLAISTGAVYSPNQNMPLTETSKTIDSGSPYAVSKLLMELEATRLRKLGLDCIVARPFNHFGPEQLPGFLIPDLKHKLLEAKNGNGRILVGNLSTRRDYTDVRDVVRAYADLITEKTLEKKLFNVCSSISRSGQEILDIMIKEMGLADKVEVAVDPNLIRPDDPPELYGSFDSLNQATGWVPKIVFEQTIKDFLR